MTEPRTEPRTVGEALADPASHLAQEVKRAEGDPVMTASERIRAARKGLSIIPPRLGPNGFTPWTVKRGDETVAQFHTYAEASAFITNPLTSA